MRGLAEDEEEGTVGAEHMWSGWGVRAQMEILAESAEEEVEEETDERRLAPTLSGRVRGQFSLISGVLFPGPPPPVSALCALQSLRL